MDPSIDNIRSIEELQTAIGTAAEADDLDTLKDLRRYFVEAEGETVAPFVPAIRIDEEALGVKLAATESNFGIELANSLDRAIRQTEFRIKIATGYNGPVIVSEGDSWFQYPFFLRDIIDNLNDQYAVFSLGGAGHHLRDMVLIQDEFRAAIEKYNPTFFLLSGGGNDMVGGGRIRTFVQQFLPGMTAAELIDRSAFASFRSEIAALYNQVASELTRDFPNLTILIHGYDYALPRDGGQWLGPSLQDRDVPKELWADVIAVMINEFNEELQSVESRFPGRVFHIDCRNQVGGYASWHDELHPKNPGYQRVTNRFLERIRAVLNAGVMPAPMGMFNVPSEMRAPELQQVMRRITSLGTPEIADRFMARSQGTAPSVSFGSMSHEAIIRRVPSDITPAPAMPIATVVTDGGVHSPLFEEDGESSSQNICTSLQAWRSWLDEEDINAYNHVVTLLSQVHNPDNEERLETRRELAGSGTFERIINDSNLFPINFLARGDRSAKAVGRISVVSQFGVLLGSGTGFLVAPGLLLTNHHVLQGSNDVYKSHVLFDYEFDVDNGFKQTERFDFTSDLFFTDEAYDFTFVSVAKKGRKGRSIEEFGYLPLIRQSGKAIKKEPVSIIQHPDGAPKQIAMRDSRIIGRMEQYIYYTTDTNPGSSGAPVINDEWLPVALHHRSVPDYNNPCNYIANRGIRISRIVERLDEAANSGNTDARAALTMIEPARSTSVINTKNMPGEAVDIAGDAQEALREPFHEIPYANRQGYNEHFLNTRIPLPTPRNAETVSRIIGSDDYVIPYEHFSVVLDKRRRLALFTASNVDASGTSQRPELGKDYSRQGLTGLRDGDREKWFKDPRVPDNHQLADQFFNEDNGAFDKGHLVRRNDVTWGDNYEQVRRANGDTFHTTNCTPQVKGFNRANEGGLWGKLENLVRRQAETERYCIIAGPVLDTTDLPFRGVDEQDEILVQIPRRYWKVIVARQRNQLQSFAFILEQDLSDVPLEFAVDATWRERMISVRNLETVVRHLTFPDEIHQADQINERSGELMRQSHNIELFI